MRIAIKVDEASSGRLIRPRALVGHSMEAPAAGGIVLALTVCFVLELVTPHDVLGTAAFIPLLAAVWLLSTRFVVLVAGTALVQFAVALLAEGEGRPTMIVMGAVGAWLLLSARLHAVNVDSPVGGHRLVRSAEKGHSTSATRGFTNLSTEIEMLSRRELEVAELASQGHSAPEIGRMLHIGERTVETHIAHVYSKLRIRSRSQLLLMSAELRRVDN